MVRHPLTKKFLQSGLFKGLGSFRQLERRIEKLEADSIGATNLLRGNAFEVFAAAYLATQRSQMVKRIWPKMQLVPPTIARRLGWHSTDHGADGLIETESGDLRAYQVKFRSGRASLPWAEVSTFFGVTDRSDDRLLFTNSTSVAEITEKRRDFISIRGNDLDQLEAADFRAMLEWLRGAKPHHKKHKPRPHQRKALSDILKAFKKEDRGTVISACGTGKTFLALWAAEALGRRSVIVLVPSLALIRQTLRDWSKNTNWKSFDYICVCSDPTVSQEEDSLVVRPTELPFSVTTEPAKVRKFLRHPFKGVKVVFTTYQSAPIVGQAMARGEAFDLGIFDEAHKTAGSEGKRNAFALSDKNLRIRKRLFLTATPRKYRLPSKDSERGKDLEPVYSMDQPEVYGRPIHKLSFGKAAAQGIICNYKVIISVVTSSAAEQQQRRRGIVMVKGDAVKAGQVVNQLAIAQAVRKHKIGKVFSFHLTKKSAASFVSERSEGVRSHLRDFHTSAISGEMPTSLREAKLQEFQDAKRGIVSNVRCLTEGVDVPAVDMVAFMSPKRSKVDIVQAVGRAMRNSPGKKFGYVLVPLHVELRKNESLEDAVKRAGFDEVWQVLGAMQEQDEVLDDAIHRIQADRTKERGLGEEVFRERVDIVGPLLAISEIRNAVTIRCVERLARPWEAFFRRLVEFKNRHGHCRVPVKSSEYSALGVWLVNQRQRHRRAELSHDQVARLEALGVEWNVFLNSWDRRFAQLREFAGEHGHCDVPQGKGRFERLSKWLSQQRILRRKDRLPVARLAALDSLGITWDVLEAAWENKFQELQRFHSEHGHSQVPWNYRRSPSLPLWLAEQRKFKRTGKLGQERIKRLSSLGVEWDKLDLMWEQRFTELVQFKSRYGHCEVPNGFARNPELARWVGTQRRLHKAGQLSDERSHRLTNLGIRWYPHEQSWEENFAALRRFKSKTGHCRVPLRSVTYPGLSRWLANQKHLKYAGRLDKKRASRLEAEGIIWNTYDKAWEEIFAALQRFRRKHGHTNVSQHDPINRALGHWITRQRVARKEKRLSPDKIQRLERIGLEWSAIDAAWDRHYSALRKFHARYGHCNIPNNRHDPDPVLGQWISIQRRAHKNGKLRTARVRALERLGIQWTPLDAAWEKKFQELVEFKTREGHCNVPSKFKRLGNWLVNQRQLKRRGKLAAQRIKRLNEIGVVWNATGFRKRNSVR